MSNREYWEEYDREKARWKMEEEEAARRRFDDSIAGKQCRIREERLAFYNSLSHNERVARHNEMMRYKENRVG